MYDEINGPKMTDVRIEKYLSRIGIEGAGEPDLGFLKKLHEKHIEAVPYENLDFLTGAPVTLDRDALYEKIVDRRRGGVCSEINTLYNWLLESLGYDVRSYISRIISTKQPIQAQSHRVIGVKLDGEIYLTDAGFNYEHHRVPILLKEGMAQSDGSCEYKLVRDPFFCWLMMQNRPEYGWRKKLGFTEEPHIDQDYAAFTYMSGAHPDSIFNKTAKVSCYKDGYFYAVRNGCFLKGNYGDEEIIEEDLVDERTKEICRDHFRLDI